MGRQEISNVYQVDRGYEDIEGKLRGVGAEIKRIKKTFMQFDTKSQAWSLSFEKYSENKSWGTSQ